MVNRLEFISILIILLSAFVCLMSAAVVLGAEFSSFECSEGTTNICDYQTFFAGSFAVLAAVVTAFFLNKQIKENVRSHIRELRVGSLQNELELYRKEYSVSVSIYAEINSLIKIVNDEDYAASFEEQAEVLDSKWADDNKLEGFPISYTSDYFKTFSSMQPELGFLSNRLTVDVCNWYVDAEGFVETIVGLNKGEYKNSDQKDLAYSLVKKIKTLIASGEDLVTKLDENANRLDGIIKELTTEKNRVLSDSCERF